MFATTQAERLATIVNCAMRGVYGVTGEHTGAWGSIKPAENLEGTSIVTLTEGDAFMVWMGRGGWHVGYMGSTSCGVSRDLEEAAQLAIEARWPRRA